tara:strand:- start:348 stop:905 length:558 start_codon:yes stop_codon:yes gene_type:complete
MKYKYIIIKSLIVLSILFTFSCSNNDDEKVKENIMYGSYDNLFLSKESFEKIGFKFNKDYNVENLPDAVSAVYGFWGLKSFDRLAYELRFYPSNKVAKESGIFYAEEVTGSDAILKKSEASWKEGIKDRSGTTFFGTISPKYMDYVIFGNVIVLCPSEKSSAVSGVSDPILNCSNMLNEVVKFVD